jgi:hypothetical protein
VILTNVQQQIPDTNNSAVATVDDEEHFVYEICAFVYHQHLSAIVWLQITVTHYPQITVIFRPKYIFLGG